MSAKRLPVLALLAANQLMGCAATLAPSSATRGPLYVEECVTLMEQARVSRGDSWRALRDELSRDVVQDPGPVPRARLALALSVGERSQGDLQRALAMLDELLDPAHTPADALEPSLRALLNVQRDALERRLENLSRISRIELDSVLREAALAREAASHDQARAERDKARAALDQARERLREVTRIELQHEATGG